MVEAAQVAHDPGQRDTDDVLVERRQHERQQQAGENDLDLAPGRRWYVGEFRQVRINTSSKK